ncbi:MAG: DNA-directed RNA polymerase subunit omega [Actinomycetota bacterium]
MLYGRRLDQALEHVDGSRYALVHAVAKRARQITLWLTADPAELRAEAAPPPAPGELATRDPVALSEAEILQGEVVVRWDPDGRAEEPDILESGIEADPLLLDGIGDDDEDLDLGDDGEAHGVAPLEAEALDADVDAEEVTEAAADPLADDEEIDEELEGDELGGVSLEAVAEEELEESDEEDEV